MMSSKTNVLTVAGSDCSGGAGIQADLKTFAALDLHGFSVITAITAQDATEVYQNHAVSLFAIDHQFEAVFNENVPSIAKTGMLYSPEIVAVVTGHLKERDIRTVVDPVLRASGGESLMMDGYIAALKAQLLPHAELLSANIPEAAMILDWPIKELKSVDGMKKAARALHHLGPKYVLVKGGHCIDTGSYPSTNTVTDVLYSHKIEHEIFTAPYRGSRKNVHGTGCIHSALITGLLAKGDSIEHAVEKAQKLIGIIIAEAYAPGKTDGLVGDPLSGLRCELQRDTVRCAVNSATYELCEIVPGTQLPEVGMNLVYALPYATCAEEVCGLDGRIVRQGSKAVKVGCAEFGGSKHIARIVLAVMTRDPEMRAAANLKFSKAILQRAKTLGLEFGSFDRINEPEGVSSMEWGTTVAIEHAGKVPDLIYDLGGVGKEAMIRVLGKDPEDVVGKIKIIMGLGPGALGLGPWEPPVLKISDPH